MIGKTVVIGGILTLALLTSGTFLLLDSLAPLEKKIVILNDTFNVPANQYENRTAWLKNNVNYNVYFSVSEGTIKFYAMDEAIASVWLQHEFEPPWIETEYYHYSTGVSGATGGGSTMYFVFLNNDAATKEVHLEVSNAWQETNYIELFEGATLALLGGIASIITKSRYSKDLTLSAGP